MDEELLVEENNHILNGTQNFGLNTRRPIRLTQTNQGPQNI
jgi:hypothetical protein